MAISYYDTEEFPFLGTFFKTEVEDKEQSFVSENESKEVEYFETPCDIVASNESRIGDMAISGTRYSVYLPIDDPSGIVVGDVFRGDMYGVKVYGNITAVSVSQFGGVVCKVEAQ